MKRFVFIIVLSILTLPSFPQSSFFRLFSDVDASKPFTGKHLVKTADGNFSFLCTNSVLPVIIRVDNNGIEFNRFSVPRYQLNPVCLAVNNQFDYYFVGRDTSHLTAYYEKTDSTGAIFFHDWEYGAVGGATAHGVFSTPDNGILYSFWNNSEMCYDPEYFVKIDSEGVFQWYYDISFNMSNPSKQSIQFLPDNGYCAIGPYLTGCYDTVQYYYSNLKIYNDSTGNFRTYNFNELYHTIDTTIGNGFIVASSGQFARLDSQAAVAWTNPMPAGMSFQIAFRPLQDSTFILAGDQFVTDSGQQVMINKYDWNGNLLWNKYYGGAGNEYFSNLVLTDDGGFLLSGTTESYGSSKAFLLKADSAGNSPSMPLITTSSGIICSGDSTMLTLPAGYTYLWNTGDTTQSIYATSANSYWAELSSAGNQFYSDTISLAVIATVQPNLGLDTTLCTGSQFILECGTDYSAYRWSTGSFEHSDTISVGGIYFVEAIDSNSCSTYDTIQVGFISLPVFTLGPDISQCGTTPVVLQSPGILQWTWSNGTSDTTLSANTSGIYSLTFSNGACSETDSIRVDIFTPVQVDLFDDTVICTNQLLQLDAGTGFLDYEWQDGTHAQVYTVSSAIPATIQYSVTVVDSNGCSTSDDIVVDFEVCSSISDFIPEKEINIFPNPVRVSEKLNLQFESGNDLYLEIFSATGELIYKMIVSQSPVELSMSNFSQGIYYLKISDRNSGRYRCSKLIVE